MNKSNIITVCVSIALSALVSVMVCRYVPPAQQVYGEPVAKPVAVMAVRLKAAQLVTPVRYANVNDNNTAIPSRIGDRDSVTWDNSQDILVPMGWRLMQDPPGLASGYVRVSCTPVDVDGFNGRWEVVDRLESEAAAEAYQAKLATLTPELLGKAYVYRLAMERNFGPGAVTNQTYTEAYVIQHFTAKAMAGTITAQDLADSELLTRTFPELTAWTGDGTAWSFPWGYVP